MAFVLVQRAVPSRASASASTAPVTWLQASEERGSAVPGPPSVAKVLAVAPEAPSLDAKRRPCDLAKVLLTPNRRPDSPREASSTVGANPWQTGASLSDWRFDGARARPAPELKKQCIAPRCHPRRVVERVP